MSISMETLLQAREEAETGNDQYSAGFVSAVITELLETRKALDTAHKVFAAECDKMKASEQPVGITRQELADELIGEVVAEAKLEAEAFERAMGDSSMPEDGTSQYDLWLFRKGWDAAETVFRDGGMR